MLTRRQFLVSAPAVIAPPLLAADPKPDFSFALVTDTHLGKPGADYVKRMADVVTEINAAPAAFTVFCGDLVDHGETPANQKLYGQWVELAKGLKAEWTAVPGNHDPAAQFTRHVRKETESVIDFKGCRLIGFADAEPNPGHMGVVTEDQLKWLQARLDEAKGKRVILAAHVIYHENKHPDVGWYIKDKASREPFGKLLAASKQVVAFFAGHFHCGMRGWDDTAHGIHEVILPCASYNNDRKLDKAPGFAVREFRPAWVRVDVFDSKLVLHYKRVGADVAATRELPVKA
jgi:3',5'-cyclic AMP phosphodiesterase CpdA